MNQNCFKFKYLYRKEKKLINSKENLIDKTSSYQTSIRLILTQIFIYLHKTLYFINQTLICVFLFLLLVIG